MKRSARKEPAHRAAPAFLHAFEGAIDDYLAELSRRGSAPGTIALYRNRLLHLGRFLAEREGRPLAHLSDITPADVSAFRDHEIGRPRKRADQGPLASSTLYLLVSILRGFFRHLVRQGVLLLDPVADLMGPRRSRRLPREVPTTRQMRKLLSAPDTERTLGKRDRAILELFYSSGLRNAELCDLLLGDVNVASRTVFVRRGKGGKERLVPMGRKAAEALSVYLAAYGSLPAAPKRPGRRTGKGSVAARAEASPPLFLSLRGGRLHPDAIRRLLARHLRKSRVTVKATPHSLRHACATHLLRGGAGIRQIQTLLGHASLESTQIYTRVETSDLRAMLDRHHPRGRAVEELAEANETAPIPR